MTAIQTMKMELVKIQQAQAGCVNKFGFVNSEYKYLYQELTRKAKDFKSSIDWLESQVYT